METRLALKFRVLRGCNQGVCNFLLGSVSMPNSQTTGRTAVLVVTGLRPSVSYWLPSVWRTFQFLEACHTVAYHPALPTSSSHLCLLFFQANKRESFCTLVRWNITEDELISYNDFYTQELCKSCPTLFPYLAD